MMAPSRPVVGVVADVGWFHGQPYHMAQDKYLNAVLVGADCFPLIVPSFGEALDLPDLISGLDGLLLTGAISNVEPERYGGPTQPGCGPYDPARDATSLPLIDLALGRALPMLAICRGFQELNVALGGSLNPRLHETPGLLDHRADYKLPVAEQYEPVHSLSLTPGGVLAGLIPGTAEIRVNSLHWQGIERLAPGLSVEAVAPDGTIEGIRVTVAPAFALGVQWHPEWEVEKSPFSMALFRHFGDAARVRRAIRLGA